MDARVLRLYILGPTLGLLLHQRGWLILHASGISIDQRAILFLGAPGWGKSTTAAALYAHGHAIVADDVIPVELNGESTIVHPGFPQLKLWPEAAASLGDSVETLPRVHPNFEKRVRRTGDGFALSPLPLKCIYVLAEGAKQEIQPIGAQYAIVELVRHSYAAQFLGATETSALHFEQCARLANRVPIRALRRPRALKELSELARLVENDVAQN